MIFLRALKRVDPSSQTPQYPFSTPVCSGLNRLEFTRPVTFIVGENGTGKTTLLEIMAALMKSVRIDQNSPSRSGKLALFDHMEKAFRIEMARKPLKNFFFKAEDFIKYIDALHQMRQEAREGLDEVKISYQNKSSYARGLASMPYASALYEMDRLYQNDITQRSHGESFIDFFGSRIVENGLYLIDEPEAALSFFNQLVLMNLIADAEKKNCQIIISTHSPILTAHPGACIYEIGEDHQLRETQYQDIENIKFLKSFLDNREAFLRHFKEDLS